MSAPIYYQSQVNILFSSNPLYALSDEHKFLECGHYLPQIGTPPDSFLSTTDYDYYKLVRRTRALIEDLKAQGYVVKSYTLSSILDAATYSVMD